MEKVPCPYCGSTHILPFDDGSGFDCAECGEFTPDSYVEWYLSQEENREEYEHNPS